MVERVLDFESIKENKTLSDLDLKIFAVLNDVLQPNVSLEDGEAAKRIDELAPLGHQSEDGVPNDEKIEGFLWSLWSLVIEVIQLVPRDNQGHTRITLLVKSLSQIARCTCTIWGSETSLWKDLPLLGAFMRDNWTCKRTSTNPNYKGIALTKLHHVAAPTYKGEVPEVDSAEKWANLNSFAARLFGESLAQWKNFAVWSLNAALEEEIQDQKTLECNLVVAQEWITQAGERILREASEQPSDKECRVMSAGSLFKGKAGLSLERWEFWKVRFREIGRLTSGDISKICIAMANKMDGTGGTLDPK
ncbi:hypothetical protein N7451_006544 [Penicillium sp. IBT 35674x]|nr:hypothetical protein N7451_006544 [Penicillium sp. IBT 35674x]